MSFKNYPQPPFKKFVKCEYGKILEVQPHNHIEPAVFSKNGKPLTRFGWTITYTEYFANGIITFVDKVIATADTKEELENE